MKAYDRYSTHTPSTIAPLATNGPCTLHLIYCVHSHLIVCEPALPQKNLVAHLRSYSVAWMLPQTQSLLVTTCSTAVLVREPRASERAGRGNTARQGIYRGSRPRQEKASKKSRTLGKKCYPFLRFRVYCNHYPSDPTQVCEVHRTDRV